MTGNKSTVAIRTMMDASPIKPINSIDLRNVIGQTRREQDFARAEGGASLKLNNEAVIPRVYCCDGVQAYLHGLIPLKLGPALRQQLRGRRAFVAKQTIHTVRGMIAGAASVGENDGAAAAPKNKRCAEASGTRTYDSDVGNLAHNALLELESVGFKDALC